MGGGVFLEKIIKLAIGGGVVSILLIFTGVGGWEGLISSRPADWDRSNRHGLASRLKILSLGGGIVSA